MMRKAAILLLLFWSVWSQTDSPDDTYSDGTYSPTIDAVSYAAGSEVFAESDDFTDIEVGLAKDNDLAEAFGMVEDAVDLRRNRRNRRRRWAKKAALDAKKKRYLKALRPCIIACSRNRICRPANARFRLANKQKTKAAERRVWRSLSRAQRYSLLRHYMPCVKKFVKQERLRRIYGRCGVRCIRNKVCRGAARKFRGQKFTENFMAGKTFKSLSRAQQTALALAFRPCYRQAWAEHVTKIFKPCFARCGRSLVCRRIAAKFRGAKSDFEKRRRWRRLSRRAQLILVRTFGPCIIAFKKEIDLIKKIIYKPCHKKCAKSWGCRSAMKKFRGAGKWTKKRIYATYRKLSKWEKIGLNNAYKSCRKTLKAIKWYLTGKVIALPIDLIA